MATITLLEKFGAVRRGLSRLALRNLKDLKLGPKQVVVIREVNRRGEASITELAEAAVSDLAAVSRMVASLVKSNWLTRSPHPQDARQSVIRLGAKAKRRMPELQFVIEGVANAMSEPLTSEEAETLMTLLTKIEASVAAKNVKD